MVARCCAQQPDCNEMHGQTAIVEAKADTILELTPPDSASQVHEYATNMAGDFHSMARSVRKYLETRDSDELNLGRLHLDRAGRFAS